MSIVFLNNRGFIKLELGQIEEGKDDIDLSITKDPTNAWAYRNKGWYYFKAGKPEDALKLLKRSAKLDPFVDKVYLLMGQVYESMGDAAKACENYKLAIERKENVVTELICP